MRNWRIVILISLLAALFSIKWASAQTVTGLAWDAPLMDDLTGIFYRIYVCDGPILDDKTCIGKLETHDGITELNFSVAYDPTTKKGDIYFRASAYYIDGNESELSNQVSRPFDLRGTPIAPANLRQTAP